MLFNRKAFLIILLTIKLLSPVHSTRRLHFRTLYNCTTNKQFAFIENCELDDVYISIGVKLSSPITKMMVISLEMAVNYKKAFNYYNLL